MLKHRVIPVLLLRNEGLVKTSRFKDPKYAGDPINAIRIFNEKEVDELMVMDINASVESREPNYSLIEQFAGECFMPLAYGGGIRSIDQAQRIFSLGVEKISIQSGALEDPTFIGRLKDRFGSQSIIASVDAGKTGWENRKSTSPRPKRFATARGSIMYKHWLKPGQGNSVECGGSGRNSKRSGSQFDQNRQ